MKFVPKAISLKAAQAGLTLSKNSPTLLFAGGVVGVVASTVLACKATLKLEEVLEETNDKLDQIKNISHDNYSEQDRTHDRTIVLVRGGVAVAKLYGPAVIVGALSITALVGSHKILTKRNAALTAAYAAVDKAFGEYRARVREELGEDKDREFRYGVEEKVAVDETTGEKTKIKVASTGEPSMYAKFFDEFNQNWSSTNPEYNVAFLRFAQKSLNDQLDSKGHVFLNEAYDQLGLPRTKAGCVVGWLKGKGDDYIDFGIFTNERNEEFLDFVTGRERSILLDFNVNGVIYEDI